MRSTIVLCFTIDKMLNINLTKGNILEVLVKLFKLTNVCCVVHEKIIKALSTCQFKVLYLDKKMKKTTILIMVEELVDRG